MSSSQRPASTTAPSPCAPVASSATRRVLPMPGSPPTRITRRPFDRASCHTSASIACSLERPANGMPVGPVNRPGSGTPASISTGSHRTSQVASGAGRPLSVSSPIDSMRSRVREPAIRRMVSVISSCPAAQAAHNRAASTTGVPNQSPSSTTTSPIDTPIFTPMASSGCLRPTRSHSTCISTAAAMAFDADRNTTMSPSPRFFASVPR